MRVLSLVHLHILYLFRVYTFSSCFYWSLSHINCNFPRQPESSHLYCTLQPVLLGTYTRINLTDILHYIDIGFIYQEVVAAVLAGSVTGIAVELAAPDDVLEPDPDFF